MSRPRLRLPRRTPPPFPWRRPRFELALLALVAVAALSPVYPIDAQDVSRICLTRALLRGQLSNDSCLNTTLAIDKAVYNGHLYSDKAPGMSALEIPGVALARVPSPQYWPYEDIRLWVVRVLAGGLAFLACVFCVGRISEGLAPGYGGAALVAFGLGTLAAPFAAANFEHDTAGMLGLLGFALAWRRRPQLAGLAGGAALLVAYEAAMIVAVVGVYLALQGGWALVNYVRGLLPGAALLWTYNWLAFGEPWHLSYRYIVGGFAPDQASGFFGVHLPYLHATRQVFVGSGGLLVLSPVLLAAGYGLVLLGRRYPAEALVCAALAAAFILLNCGYFQPYGGVSPGPRFLVPCLPFLCLGLGPAFAAHFRLTALLAAASVIAMTPVTLTWPILPPGPGSIWEQIVHYPAELGSSPLATNLSSNVIVWLDSSRGVGAALVACAAAAALACSLTSGRRREGLPTGDGAPAA
jgi:hypothetical protein